jgi:hypothetical protein
MMVYRVTDEYLTVIGRHSAISNSTTRFEIRIAADVFA